MVASAATRQRPASIEEAAELLRELGGAGRPLRVRGGGTKSGWGRRCARADVEVETGGLTRLLEHNAGDFTAVLEAGVPLAEAQERFAAAGQMLALDPPLSAPGGAAAATIGGVVATADSGPLRHRYGGVRDLVLGITVVLSDGTVARAGGRVIKNVAGYDLGKLFAGSHGTLGLIATVAVRLHPLATEHATVRARSEDPDALARASSGMAALPLEADCLDVHWTATQGEVLARFSGPAASERAERTAGRLAGLGLEAEVVADGAALWERQRACQRTAEGAVLKVAGVIGDLPAVLGAAREAGAQAVARAGLGLAWLTLPGDRLDARLRDLRERLPATTLTLLGGAERVGDPWPAPEPGALAVMQRIKARFDPADVFAPGTFVGGL
ncbi:MAG: FAD-binding oxidoreductase [Candidatus Dormibacteria bacterium]